MTPEQATAALAQKTAEYKAAQATAAGAVPPPPPGRPATTPAQAAARLAQLKADPHWRAKRAHRQPRTGPRVPGT